MQGDIRRVLSIVSGVMLAAPAVLSSPHPPVEPVPLPSEPDRKRDLYINAYVTGYNTVTGQTDDTPCIAASGRNICGHRDTAACPRLLKLGTIIEIRGRQYVCEDRTARKYNHRFDVNCDQDRNCPYQVAGWTNVKVVTY